MCGETFEESNKTHTHVPPCAQKFLQSATTERVGPSARRPPQCPDNDKARTGTRNRPEWNSIFWGSCLIRELAQKVLALTKPSASDFASKDNQPGTAVDAGKCRVRLLARMSAAPSTLVLGLACSNDMKSSDKFHSSCLLWWRTRSKRKQRVVPSPLSTNALTRCDEATREMSTWCSSTFVFPGDVFKHHQQCCNKRRGAYHSPSTSR